MPGPGDSRVKAYRKQVRKGMLPPVLLWRVSGLDCHLILDGHARPAAAIAESVEPSLLQLQLHRMVPHDGLAARIDDAVGFYEDELERFAELRAIHGPTVPDGTAGPRLARLLRDLNTAEQPTWAWPLPGGEDQWRRIAGEVTVGRNWVHAY
ncbi:hypothetical protein [Streptomyces sp. NPDC059787]|uniref:hypothetical protein n=1 Tax=Streptomyces sp. NPDC059787 TaxID=3346947 RepID=UPI003658383E